jgi:hypothetical protein
MSVLIAMWIIGGPIDVPRVGMARMTTPRRCSIDDVRMRIGRSSKHIDHRHSPPLLPRTKE